MSTRFAFALVLTLFATSSFAQTTRPARLKPIVGTVASIDGFKIVVHPPVQAIGNIPPDVTVTADEDATVMVDGFRAGIADVKAAMNITIRQLPPRGDEPAEMVITALSSGLNGTITKIEPTAITLSTKQKDGTTKETIVAIDDKTIYLGVTVTEGTREIDPAVKGRDDAKVGLRVRVIPETGTATKIYVLTTPPRATTGPSTKPTTKMAV